LQGQFSELLLDKSSGASHTYGHEPPRRRLRLLYVRLYGQPGPSFGLL